MEKLLISRIEASKMLDMSVEKLDAYRKVHQGPPFVQWGGSVKYSPKAIAAWIEEQSKQR